MNKEFRRLALQKMAEDAGISADTETVSAECKDVKDDFTLAKILKDAGVLTDFVEKKLKGEEPTAEPSDFKSKFLKLKTGPEREKLVFEEAIKRGPSIFGDFVPITVPGPGGTKITYEAQSDFIIIDGFRPPMSGETLQKIANHFGVSLLTSKMTEQIWDAAGEEGQVAARPLSGSGVKIKGKYYTPQQVVERLIGDSDAAMAYNEIMDEAILEKTRGKSPRLIAGIGKTIVMTNRPDQLGLYGARDAKGNIIQDSEYTGHDTKYHAEYMTYGRVSRNPKIHLPDGRVITTTMDELLEHPEMYKAISNTKVKKYRVS